MSVLVDTSIWSTVFRRGTGSQVAELERLIRAGEVRLLGAIRQESLQGYRDPQRFELMRQRLAAFPDFPVSRLDYEQAASYFNLLRSRGIQSSNTDLLICAVAVRHDSAIFTSDKDFQRYARHVPIRLHLASR